MSDRSDLAVLQLLVKAETINDRLLAIAKKKVPDRDPQVVLSDLMAVLGSPMDLATADYKTKLDAMAQDMGPDHFKALQSNPDFQNIFDKWLKDRMVRIYQKMTEDLAAWTGGEVPAAEIDLLIKAMVIAQEKAESKLIAPDQ